MNDAPAAFPAYFALLFPVFFAVLWILICVFIGFVSGWRGLSRRFRCDRPPYGDVRTAGPLFYSIYTRFWGHYSSVIRLTAAQDALYLSVLGLFRAGHPPLRIPWSEIRFGRTRFLWRRFVVLTLGNEERIPMRIPERMALKLGISERFLLPGSTAAC